MSLSLIGGTLDRCVSTIQSEHQNTKHRTYSVVQGSLVATEDTAVLAETSTRGIVSFLSIESLLAAKLLESLLAVLL